MSIDKKYLDRLYKAAYNATQHRNGYCLGYIYSILSGNCNNTDYLNSTYGCSQCIKKKEDCEKEIPTSADALYLSMLSPEIIIELINIYKIHMRTRILEG